MSRALQNMLILYTPQTEKFAKGVIERFTEYIEERYREEFLENNTGIIKLYRHRNNEVEPIVVPTARKRNVYAFHSFCSYDGITYDPNIGFMTLYLIDDALRRMSPDEITYVLPHIPYQRQDFCERPHVPISAARVVRMIPDYNLIPTPTRIVTFDAHAKQYQGFANTIFDPLKAMPLHEKWVRDNGLAEDSVVVSADAGALNSARIFARKLNAQLAIGNKIRSRASKVDSFDIVGKEYVKGKRVIIYEDLVDTFSTGDAIAKKLREEGAEDIYLLATHGIFSATDNVPAEERIRESKTKVVVTNSIQRSEEYLAGNSDWLSMIGLEEMLARLLYSIQRGDPVTPLYETDNWR